ncbi:hypothetical protein DFH08DRAFT_976473 [Mycena albidolilacea]|uniref:Uncharacterized protein n=1 Tax=Mycena albidolilacea TaxID=1033008 RepID=A0AAD7EAD2_9AGAR|nr:hypothetical protein DFH08DRAFT_976473 [Mycena albidolilacea]
MSYPSTFQPPSAPLRRFPLFLNHSNVTKRGFSDPTQILLGFPLTYDPIRIRNDDLIDPRRNASWFKHDLALPYFYDTVQYYLVEGEWFSFPVTRTVWRRDRHLSKSEILDYLQRGIIPKRYPPRVTDGVVNEPMNKDNWKLMVRRFYLKFPHLPYVFERSTGYPVQNHYTEFERNLRRVLPLLRSDQQAFVSQGTDFVLASVIARTGKMWYIDAQLRILLATLRILLGLERGVVFPYPGVMDAGETAIDGFEFDNGDEEVEIDC